MFTGIPIEIAEGSIKEQSNYNLITDYIVRSKTQWRRELLQGRNELVKQLKGAKYKIITGEERTRFLDGQKPLVSNGLVVTCRLKETDAIIAKMQRFDESLVNMLDIWGYRVVTSEESDLEGVAAIAQNVWHRPTKEELLLRHGELQFEWYRDYRRRSHAGLSDATSLRYDHAIHMNRRSTFGICEIQVMTEDLYKRAFLTPRQDEAHVRFVHRRKKLITSQQKSI